MRLIHSRGELVELARELGVRPDWHEPDEQGLTARVFGVSFDNAGFWPYARYDPSQSGAHGSVYSGAGTSSPETSVEMYVVLYQGHPPGDPDWNYGEPEPVAAVNLATLFAWATTTETPSAFPGAPPIRTYPDGTQEYGPYPPIHLEE